MKTKEKRLIVAVLLLVVPTFAALATAGVVLWPNRSRGRLIEADIHEAAALIRIGDEARRGIADFERFGRADFERLTAWEGSAVPRAETERDRYERLRAIEREFGVTIVSVNIGEPKALVIDGATGDEDALDESVETPPAPYALLPIEIELDGFFEDIAAALDALQTGPRLSIFRELKLAPRDDGVVRLRLSFSTVLPAPETSAANPLAGN